MPMVGARLIKLHHPSDTDLPPNFCTSLSISNSFRRKNTKIKTNLPGRQVETFQTKVLLLPRDWWLCYRNLLRRSPPTGGDFVESCTGWIIGVEEEGSVENEVVEVGEVDGEEDGAGRLAAGMKGDGDKEG